MAKNKMLINACKIMQRHINQLTPNIYAALALAMYRSGMSGEDISEIFSASQEIWNECALEDVDMVGLCEIETGIEVRNEIER